jgi:predicted MPP superfamily phosphohydrolase
LKRAIIVHYYSESLYLPLWEKYYAPFFDHMERIVVTKQVYWDFPRVVQLINNKLDALLQSYDMVAVTDVDEFIVPNMQKYDGLGDYMDKMTFTTVRPLGYNIIEMPNNKILDIKRKITTQRKYWQRDSLYDKPVITKVPIVYNPGKHRCNLESVPQDDDLRLFHLRDADLDYLVHGSGIVRSYQFLERIKQRQALAEPIPKEWRVI